MCHVIISQNKVPPVALASFATASKFGIALKGLLAATNSPRCTDMMRHISFDQGMDTCQMDMPGSICTLGRHLVQSRMVWLWHLHCLCVFSALDLNQDEI